MNDPKHPYSINEYDENQKIFNELVKVYGKYMSMIDFFNYKKDENRTHRC